MLLIIDNVDEGLFAIDWGTRSYLTIELAPYTFRRKATMPPRWVPPAEALERFADFGISVDDVVDSRTAHLRVVGFVWRVPALPLVAGPLKGCSWINRSSEAARYGYPGLGFACKLLYGPCFLVLTKLLLWPLAEWVESGPTIGVGAATACLYTLATLRLTRIDTELDRLMLRANPFDWSIDRATGTVVHRKYVHPLSAKSLEYDVGSLALRLLMLLNTLFVVRIPDHCITTAALRLILGTAAVALGLRYDRYFPPMPGQRDEHRVQNALDAGLVAIFGVGLVFVVVASQCTADALDSALMTCLPLLAIPVTCAGYYIRGFRMWCTTNRGDYERLLQEDSDA